MLGEEQRVEGVERDELGERLDGDHPGGEPAGKAVSAMSTSGVLHGTTVATLTPHAKSFFRIAPWMPFTTSTTWETEKSAAALR